jgi:CBS domain-containing protein
VEEIARFLAAHPPFDALPAEVLEQTASTVEVGCFPRGARILRQRDRPSRYLYVIVEGLVELRQAADDGGWELVETLAEGETFGQLSLLSRSPHLWDAVAGEQVVAYLIPAEQVELLRRHRGFEALLADRAGDQLRHAIAASRERAPVDLLSRRAGELPARALVTCAPEETVAEANRYACEPRHSIDEPLDHHAGVGTGELTTRALYLRGAQVPPTTLDGEMLGNARASTDSMDS